MRVFSIENTLRSAPNRHDHPYPFPLKALLGNCRSRLDRKKFEIKQPRRSSAQLSESALSPYSLLLKAILSKFVSFWKVIPLKKALMITRPLPISVYNSLVGDIEALPIFYPFPLKALLGNPSSQDLI